MPVLVFVRSEVCVYGHLVGEIAGRIPFPAVLTVTQLEWHASNNVTIRPSVSARPLFLLPATRYSTYIPGFVLRVGLLFALLLLSTKEKKLYPTTAVKINCIWSGNYMGNIDVDFDATGLLLIVCSAFVKYSKKMWIKWSNDSAPYRFEESLWFSYEGGVSPWNW